jgi:hypothetical protein
MIIFFGLLLNFFELGLSQVVYPDFLQKSFVASKIQHRVNKMADLKLIEA